MFITKKHVPRRAFLRGAGITLALPLLDAMLPAQTSLARSGALPKTRFTGIFVPHGMAPGYWVPDGPVLQSGKLPMIMQPLDPFIDRTVILSGMWSKSAEPLPGQSGADHWVAAAYLCADKPRKTTGADVYDGTTIDQMIAEKIGQETLLPSLQLALEDPGANSSNCGEGYSCTYSNTISWSSPTQPLPMELDPQVAFERLFGSGGTQKERGARREQRRSILDSVTTKLASFKRDLGAADRARLDEYETDIREIERRIDLAKKSSGQADSGNFVVPAGVPESFDEHVKLQFDLQVLAFKADITRVSTLLYARDLTARTYPESGIDSPFHGASHHAENARNIERYSHINQYHVKCFAYYLDKLQNTKEADGKTLLDHSLILYGTNMGDSNQHLHYDVPHILVGGASGQLKGGRHLAYPAKTYTTGNLLLSILDMYGIHKDSVGDSTGRLTGLV